MNKCNMAIESRISAALLRLPPFREGIDLAPLRSSIRHERYERVEKIKECMTLREENEVLRQTVVAQRIALDAITAWNREGKQELEAQLDALNNQVSALTSERDRYLNALRRLCPSKAREVAV